MEPEPSGSFLPSISQPEGERIIELLDGTFDTTHWTRYEGRLEDISFSVPSEWKVSKENKAELIMTVDSIRRDFFALVVNPKNQDLQEAEVYVQYILQEMEKEFSGRYTISEQSKLANDYRDLFYLKMESDSLADPTYSMVITENEGYIFDFTYKVGSRQVASTDVIFNMVMHSFEFNGTSVMGPETSLYSVDFKWRE